MITVELRPSTHIVQLVAAIERFTGRWEHQAEITTVATKELRDAALAKETAAAFLLDTTTPAHLLIGLRYGLESGETDLRHPLLAAYLRAHESFTRLNAKTIEQLYLDLCSTEGPAANASGTQLYRSGVLNLTLPSGSVDSEELVFQTVPPFLASQRLEDLVEWLERELEAGDYHPLLLFGAFHLLFLQTMPFGRGNHRLSLLIIWRLMNEHGYTFVQHASFSSVLLKQLRTYSASLRQAEKTVFTSWTTLNTWLEFFLESVAASTSELSITVEKGLEEQRLTRTQKNIIEIIRSRGPVTRETIVTESGINLATVKYNLSVLSARGYLKRKGGGRTTSYLVS